MPGLLVILVISSTTSYALDEGARQNDCDSHGFDNSYYVIGEKDFIAASAYYLNIPKINSDGKTRFLSQIGQRKRTATYYDFDDLALLNAHKELLHVFDTDVPNYFADREQVQYIDMQATSNNTYIFDVKDYNKDVSSLDKHPLFGRVKRKQRPQLIENLETVSKVAVESVFEHLRIESQDSVHFITLYGITYGTVILSRFSIYNFGIPNSSLLLKFEKNNEKQSALTIQERKYLDTFFCEINEQFQLQFPYIKHFSWFGYSQFNDLAVDYLPNRAFFLKHPELYSIGQIVCLTLIGFLFIYLFIGRYSKSSSCRKIIEYKSKEI